MGCMRLTAPETRHDHSRRRYRCLRANSYRRFFGSMTTPPDALRRFLHLRRMPSLRAAGERVRYDEDMLKLAHIAKDIPAFLIAV